MAGRVLTFILYAIGILLFYGGAGGLVRRLGRKNPKVLLYHDCDSQETTYTAGLNCTTPPQTFASHLEYLSRHHRVVSVHDIAAGTAPDSAVAITFDDGYRSVYENAYPLLLENEFTATIYLISDVIGNQDLVWVNELNHALRTAPDVTLNLVSDIFPEAPAAKATAVLDYCRLNYDAEKIRELIKSLREALNRDLLQSASQARLYLDWAEIEEMVGQGITFGNHTRTHPNLERLSREEQSAEIVGAQQILVRHISEVRSLAYPFGHHSAETAHLAAEIGLESVVEVGGTNRPVVPFAVGRAHLSTQSVAGLFAHMEVVEPVKALLRAVARKQGAAHAH